MFRVKDALFLTYCLEMFWDIRRIGMKRGSKTRYLEK